MYKFSTFLAEDRRKTIQDVQTFVEIINTAVEASDGGRINLEFGKTKYFNIESAEIFRGRPKIRIEPYVDFVLNIRGGATINVDFYTRYRTPSKQFTMRHLEMLIPDIMINTLDSARLWYVKHGFEDGAASVPEVSGRLGRDDKLSLIRGNDMVGGESDVIIIHPHITRERNLAFVNNTLKVAGAKVLDPVQYAHEREVFIPLRKKSHNQILDLTGIDSNNLPILYGSDLTSKSGVGYRKPMLSDKPFGQVFDIEDHGGDPDLGRIHRARKRMRDDPRDDPRDDEARGYREDPRHFTDRPRTRRY